MVFTVLTSLSAVEIDYERLGDVLQVALPMTALGMSLTLENDYNGTVQFAKSFGATVVATQVLKFSINEKRPNGCSRSFPSGHTSAAFSGASFIQRRYGWTYGLPAYAIASYVGWSRVYANAHYSHDVIAGALLSVGFTYLFTEPLSSSDVQVTPIARDESYGLQLSMRF